MIAERAEADNPDSRLARCDLERFVGQVMASDCTSVGAVEREGVSALLLTSSRMKSIVTCSRCGTVSIDVREGHVAEVEFAENDSERGGRAFLELAGETSDEVVGYSPTKCWYF